MPIGNGQNNQHERGCEAYKQEFLDSLERLFEIPDQDIGVISHYRPLFVGAYVDSPLNASTLIDMK